jgi:hypothetical protein
MDSTIIKLGSQILLGVAAIVFTIYSIVAIYSLNTYGHSKSLTSAVSIIYSAAAAGLLAWGLAFIINLE